MLLSKLLAEFPDLGIMNDGEFNNTGFNNSAHDENILTYIIDEKYIRGLSDNISCVITTKELAKHISCKYGIGIADFPKAIFFRIHNFLSCEYEPKQEKTVFGRNCKISEKAIISNYNVFIGDNAVIEDGSVIKSGVIIGNNFVLRSGSIIGGEGYQFYEDGENTLFANHYGKALIGDNVEIQHNSIVEKALLKNDLTIIGDNTKVGCMSMVGHGVKVGKKCIVTTGVIIGGNSVIGDSVYFGINSTLKHQVNIGSHSVIGMGAAVMSDVAENTTVAGNPARNITVKIDRSRG